MIYFSYVNSVMSHGIIFAAIHIIVAAFLKLKK